MAVISSFGSTASAITAFLLFALPSVIAVTVYTTLSLPPGTGGPKSVAFDLRGGGPYAGISDGRIVKYTPPLGFIDFAFTAGTRAKTPLASSAEGSPIRFCHGLDVDPNTGVVYFTDASANYLLSNTTRAALNRDSTGRLLRFDPRTGFGPWRHRRGQRQLLRPHHQVHRRHCQEVLPHRPSANTIRTLLNVPSPSTIRRTTGGEFTVTERVRPFTHRALRIDANGTVMANVSIGGPYNNVTVVTGVQIYGLYAYVGSLYANFVGQVLGLF
ncbi:hypothetical protein EUGRSUZ_B00663 [Eucalyptus grandis]|uniref:Uncharacterized protein n=2 Tax=Eucalyptus grandis TaxID=71139 RepID=A0ACC3LNV4_EUCGR|nr:hypothetical protein EUGRSUZ_B00663 [Eucalyptus grandis]